VRSTFPNGVCDFSHRPVGKKRLADTWLSYPSPGTFEPIERGGHDHDRAE
jgi:hypothetical protein